MVLNQRRAFTLVETLIVIAIIGVLLQLLLPAVEATREAARKTTCQNNLRQIGIAAINHEATHLNFPTAGWGWGWIGDPDRGTGKDQPGSWRYQLLPYLEQQNVYQIGGGLAGDAKYDALAQLAATPVSLFYCPSRRLPRATPNMYGPVVREGFDRGNLFWYNSTRAEQLARSDYVANVGDRFAFWNEGPSPDEAKHSIGFFQLTDVDSNELKPHDITGVVFQRQPIAARQVTDGLSQTLFAGEKPMFVPDYKNGRSFNDDQSAWNGDDWDGVAATEFIPRRDPTGHIEDFGVPFGAAHPDSVVMVYCDGSVRLVDYDVDPEVHRRSGNRADESVQPHLY